MPDPILPNIIRAQVILHGESALAEDRFVNTFAFRAVNGFVGVGQTEHDEALRLLTNFYTGLNGGTKSIVSLLTGYTKAELRTYHLGDAVPREPIITDPWPGWPLAAANPLPFEVAMCASFETTRRGPRGRGRVYIGPLTSSGAAEGAGGDARPSAANRDALVLAMTAMQADNAVLEWGLVSQMDAAFYAATGGWVDDAFDTQRSRGLKPTTRQTWGSAAAT